MLAGAQDSGDTIAQRPDVFPVHAITKVDMIEKSNPPLATIAFPILAIAYVILVPYLGPGDDAASPTLSVVLSSVMVLIMLGAIFASVHHADVVAHRVGEPFGTLILTLAVTIIEVAL